MAVSWAAVTAKAVPDEGAVEGKAEGAAVVRVGRRTASAVRGMMDENILLVGCLVVCCGVVRVSLMEDVC